MDKINSVLKLREVVDKIFDDINNKHCCPPEPTEWLMYSQKCSEIHTDTKKPESFLMNYIRRIVDRISDIIMPLEPLDIPEEEFIVAHGYKFWHLLDNYFNEYCAKKKCARSVGYLRCTAGTLMQCGRDSTVRKSKKLSDKSKESADSANL